MHASVEIQTVLFIWKRFFLLQSIFPKWCCTFASCQGLPISKSFGRHSGVSDRRHCCGPGSCEGLSVSDLSEAPVHCQREGPNECRWVGEDDGWPWQWWWWGDKVTCNCCVALVNCNWQLTIEWSLRSFSWNSMNGSQLSDCVGLSRGLGPAFSAQPSQITALIKSKFTPDLTSVSVLLRCCHGFQLPVLRWWKEGVAEMLSGMVCWMFEWDWFEGCWLYSQSVFGSLSVCS